MCVLSLTRAPRPSLRRSSYASLLKCINGSTSASCISASPYGIYYTGSWYTLMAGHNATYIPQSVTYGYGVGAPGSPASDYVLTSYPFYYSTGKAHYAVAGQGSRWEVDDLNTGNGCK